MDGWTKIASYIRPMDVGFAESLLQSADIPYHVMGEALSLLPYPVPVTLWVPEEQAADAHALLTDPRHLEDPEPPLVD
jgi:hypothetical protein